MRPFITIDSETDPFKRGRIPAPFVWGVFDGQVFRHYHHDNLHSLIEWLSEQDAIIYAHNGGKFDYMFLLPYLQEFDNIKIINGRIAQFRIGKAEFRDSYNILPVPLSAFAKDDFDYKILEKDVRYIPDNWEKTIEYLKSDCVNLYNMIAAFQEEYGRHLTQAGAALAQWKKISGLKVPNSSREFFDEFKPFYFGGRVQCFKIGIIEKRFSVFDINSAYPRAMMEKHAYGLDFIESDKELNDFPRVTGFFTLSCISRGAFPLRTKTGLSFPDDENLRVYNVTGWELQAALDTGTISRVTITRAVYFPELQDFGEYITHFYEKRLTAKAAKDKAGDLFAKLLMNSLYGKFGTDSSNYSEFIVLPQSEMESLLDPENEFKNGGELGPWILGERDLREDEQKYFNVATAASVTGYVRAFLWRAVCATGKENALYCDTDSIATHSEGHELDSGKMLGQWKHEGEFDKAGIGGKKMYIFRGVKRGKLREYKTASKGVKLSNSQLWSVAKGKEILYKPENPTFSVHSKPRFIARRINLTK